MTNERNDLSFEVLDQVSGGIRYKLPSSIIEPRPRPQTSYNNNSFDNDPQTGGYIGDGNYLSAF